MFYDQINAIWNNATVYQLRLASYVDPKTHMDEGPYGQTCDCGKSLQYIARDYGGQDYLQMSNI